MKLYLNVFIMGLATSWGPCVSFCAPILIPYVAATQKGWLSGLKVSLAFSLARIFSYVILSLISVSLVQFSIRRFFESSSGLVIYFAAGAFISLLGILILLGKSERLHFCLPYKKINAEGLKEMLLLGIMVGFMPCLPLLGLLTYIAFNAHNLLQAMSLGLSFGAGTLFSPLILFGSAAGSIAVLMQKRPLLYKIVSRACGLLLLYFGTGIIMHGLR